MCPGYCCSGRLLAHSTENALAVVLDTFFVFAQVFQRSKHVMLVTAHRVCELVERVEDQIADCVRVVPHEIVHEVLDTITVEIRVERGVEAVFV